MNSSRATIALYSGLVFASGAALGVYGDRYYAASTQQETGKNKGRRTPSPDEFRKMYLNGMQKQLLLSDDQVSKLSNIMDETRSLLDDMHGQFIAAVANGRKMKIEDVKPIADGRVWTGQEAKQLKMIDEIGDFDKAVHDTAKAVGIEGEPTIVRPERQRRTLFDLMFGDVSDYIPSSTKLMENHPGFYFLWK